jgi:hypothetical protein
MRIHAISCHLLPSATAIVDAVCQIIAVSVIIRQTFTEGSARRISWCNNGAIRPASAARTSLGQELLSDGHVVILEREGL